MNLVVIGKPSLQLSDDLGRGRQLVHIYVVALESFDEGLAYAVGLGRVGQLGADQQPQ